MLLTNVKHGHSWLSGHASQHEISCWVSNPAIIAEFMLCVSIGKGNPMSNGFPNSLGSSPADNLLPWHLLAIPQKTDLENNCSLFPAPFYLFFQPNKPAVLLRATASDTSTLKENETILSKCWFHYNSTFHIEQWGCSICRNWEYVVRCFILSFGPFPFLS